MTWTVDGLDVRVAERLCALTGTTEPALRTLASLAAAAPRGGHVCVDLDDVDGEVVLQSESPTGAGERPPPEPLDPLGDPRPLLLRAVAGDLARTADQADRVTPLVVDDSRVYLDRYWAYEDRLHDQLVARSTGQTTPDDLDAVREVLDVVAPRDDQVDVDRQRVAVANALLRRLSVISGGPGTGKTHTVVSILVGAVLLAERRGEPVPRIAIAAPTGKAAARMEQAIAEAVTARGLPPRAIDVVTGVQGRTVHRLLGVQRWSPTRFRHGLTTPLPHDLVIVDEASMVPLSMMTKLVEAVARDATLVLVGDRNQLASVEAGAVLGDVCGPSAGPSLRLSTGWATVLADVTGEPVRDAATTMPDAGVWDGIVQLERLRRFDADSGIGAIARAMQGDGAGGAVVAHLRGELVEDGAAVSRHADVELVPPADGPTLPSSLRDRIVAALAPYLTSVEAAGAVGAAADAGDGDAVARFEHHAREALQAMDAARVLCAVREGRLGVAGVRELVERWVAATGRIQPTAEWYEGRPVLVTRNDHDLGVMNGDVGVTLQRGERLVVAFVLADDTVRFVPASRVADCETVWAMTIHKAQGSQFDHAVVVLPDRDSEVVTRELVYTGVTRAKQQVTIVATEDRLLEAVARPVRRATGLRERLWPSAGQ